MKAKEFAQAKRPALVTVLFTGIIGITEVSSQMCGGDQVDEISACFSTFDCSIQVHSFEKINMIGDFVPAGR